MSDRRRNLAGDSIERWLETLRSGSQPDDTVKAEVDYEEIARRCWCFLCGITPTK